MQEELLSLSGVEDGALRRTEIVGLIAKLDLFISLEGNRARAEREKKTTDRKDAGLPGRIRK